MGRFAQCRRRGTAREQAPRGPPPAPVLSISYEADLIATAQGGDDTDGRVRLEFSGDFGESWETDTLEFWLPVLSFGDWGNYGTGWWRVVEEGNGVTYIGDSEPSNVLVQE